MKQPLLILHGAIGASLQLKPLAEKLANKYDVHLFDFPGHGGKDLPAEDFSIRLFAEAAYDFIQKNNLQKLVVFGYSMGGYVAIYLAKQYPELFSRIITLGTKFHWDEEIAAREIKMMDAETLLLKVPAFAKALEKLHQPTDWKEILKKTALMLTEMGKQNPMDSDDYSSVKTPSLIMLGDRDKMVSLAETVAVYKILPNAQLAVLPGTSHPIEQADASLIAYFIER